MECSRKLWPTQAILGSHKRAGGIKGVGRIHFVSESADGRSRSLGPIPKA